MGQMTDKEILIADALIFPEKILPHPLSSLMKSLKPAMSAISNVYSSLDQVLKTLTLPEVFKHGEVQKLLQRCCEQGIIEERQGCFLPSVLKSVAKDSNFPFVVIEGLDGSGKTFLTQLLKEKYQMVLMQTPPPEFKEFRPFFDQQLEFVRRAFYSLGNYWAGENVLKCSHPVIMDRFYHSTLAYAVASELKVSEKYTKKLNTLDCEYKWPSDLVCPNLVMFLVVSETERVRRHTSRQNFTNTAEEQVLAHDKDFRSNVVNFYKSIKGPTLVEIAADGSKDEVAEWACKVVEESFPSLRNRFS